MEVQVLETLQDSIISISVILMRSLGKLLFFGCAFELNLIVITPAFSVTCIGDIFIHLSTCYVTAV